MKRWSKLQSALHELLEPSLSLRLHCAKYRMNSQRGSTDLPRYWFTLARRVIWDYPRHFIHSEAAAPEAYPYLSHTSAISDLIREYIDSPRHRLSTREFPSDLWGLTDLLKAGDRRLGISSLRRLQTRTCSTAAQAVLAVRLSAPAPTPRSAA